MSSGSVTVNDDSSVQILAEEACTIEDIDIQVWKSKFLIITKAHNLMFYAGKPALL